ncbi:MAG: hypothetical protein RSB38_09310, partial [Oscillospiraceae bacterium]
MMRLYGEKYADMGREFTEQDFWHEFTAENCETLFTNKNYIDKLAGKSKTLAQKILDFIRNMWNRLVGKSNYTNSIATEVAGLSAGTLAKAETMYAKALGIKSWERNSKNTVFEVSNAEKVVDNVGFGEYNYSAYDDTASSNDNDWSYNILNDEDLGILYSALSDINIGNVGRFVKSKNDEYIIET